MEPVNSSPATAINAGRCIHRDAAVPHMCPMGPAGHGDIPPSRSGRQMTCRVLRDGPGLGAHAPAKKTPSGTNRLSYRAHCAGVPPVLKPALVFPTEAEIPRVQLGRCYTAVLTGSGRSWVIVGPATATFVLIFPDCNECWDTCHLHRPLRLYWSFSWDSGGPVTDLCRSSDSIFRNKGDDL